MIALLQRVTHAQVVVDGACVGQIEHGILALIGVEKEDGETEATRLLERMLSYRLFADEEDRMNLSLQEIEGGLLLVPQFTLAANTDKGRRPSFAAAAPPQVGKKLFHFLLQAAEKKQTKLASGIFGANMQVSLCNDGPVTFWLQVN
ncbi:MAG: D-aminoacyl-tRNA deacylase [Gammaproteobacteria bacterium]|nr:D-aminoacyl-tRNA deacylase [Gammaproteobacteria bacterium]